MAGFKSVQDQDDFVMRDLSRSLAALLGYLEKHRTAYSSDIDKLSSKVRTDIRKVKLRVKNLKNSERRLTRRTESLRNELACIDNYTKIKRKIRHELRQELDNSRRSQRLIPQTRIKRDQLRRDMERQAERNTQLTRQNEEATVIILSQVHEVSRLQEEIFGLKVNLKDLKAFSDANMTEIHYRYKLLTNRLLKEKDDQLCKMQLIVSKLRETQANCGGRLQCTALQCYEGEIGRHALNTKEDLMTEKQGLEADLRRRDRKLKENDDKMNELNKFISSLNMKIKSSEKDMEQRDRKIKEQEDIINSIKHEMIQINNRNKDLEHTLKKDNEQLLQKSTQLNQKIQTESEMSRTITSLKRKTQCLSQELLDSIKEKDRQQHALNQLHDKEAEFKRTFISLNTSIQHLEKEVDDRDIRIKLLKDMLDNKKIEIPNANELELNTQLKKRDDQLSELSIQLQHTLEQMQETETAFDARVTSQRKKIQHLESELDQCILTINCKTVQMTEMSKVNKHLEKNVKENDGIIRKQGDQLNCTLNRLQEIETEFVGTNISLKKKEQELERLDQKVKDLEETLAKMRTEINGGNEHLLNQVKEKDKQLSDLSDQLHEAFEQLHENDIKQGETITSLKQENVHLVARVNSSEMQVYTLEKMLDNTISEITDINERSANNAANENDDQISDMKVQLDLTLKSMHDKESDLNGLITTLKKKSREKDDQMLELSDQLTRTLNQLHDKETEMRQNDIALQKKQKYIEEEVDDNKWKIKHLEELLNRKENEMTQIIHKNKLLEKKLMENYKSISERDQTLKNLDLTVKELEKIINNRDLTVKDLEEKLQKMRTEIRDGSDSLVIELKDKDQQLSKQAARLQQILNQLHEKESELGGTISLLKRQIQGKDDHISELKQALKLLGDREFEMKEIDTSLRTKLDYLEKELERREREVEKHLEDILNSKTAEITKMSAQNEYLENKVKEKDELIDQRDRVLKEQQEAKTELCGIITSLQKKNEDLGTDINDRDLTVKDLEKRLERMRMEISGGNERLLLAMTEKDKQISKQAAKLQHALNKLHETEAELGGIITSLKKQIQGKDDQISKLGDQLKQTLKLLDDKESEVKEIDATLRKKIEYLQEELERRKRKAETHLQEMLNRKTAEITKMRAETDLLEIKLKENDKQSDQRDRILRRLQKAETESSRIINSLQEKNYGLDTDIKGRDKKVKDLEEKNAKMKTESRVENERLIMEVMGKDKQISEQTLRLEQALSQFHVKETKLGETIISLRTECQAKDGLISELRDQLKQTLEKLDVRDSELKEIETSLQEMERQKRNFKAEIHLKEMLKNTNVEKSNVRERNETLENKVKEKDKQLIEQRDQLRQTVKQMNETQDKLDGVITSQKKTIQHLQREVERRALKINDIEKLLHSIKTENRGNQQSEAVIEKEVKIAELKDQLQKTLTTLQDTEAELDETKTRLSKAMGDRLTDNNPNITDLSDKNRPTKLAERCAELYDNQWTDAFDILDKYFDTEENVIGALLEILQDTMTFCIKRAHEQMEELGRELKFADQHGNGDVSADVRKLLKDCRKAVAPVAVGNLYTMYESRLKRSTDKTLRTALEVSSYTSECLEICWFMVIQDPPVAFAPLLRKGSSFNTDLYKPYTSSGTNIDYVVWPPLLLHESGPILAKGVAQGYGKKSKKSAE